jgi:hypothetical protein
VGPHEQGCIVEEGRVEEEVCRKSPKLAIGAPAQVPRLAPNLAGDQQNPTQQGDLHCPSILFSFVDSVFHSSAILFSIRR